MRDYSPTAVRPGMGCLLQDCRRHGCRRRAYKDVFTARLEKDIPYPGEQIPPCIELLEIDFPLPERLVQVP